ncbi:NUT1 Mediator of RNA polymerase II transcription subunit 5 [Candida maltosa Xu316]|uniref:Mediator of RNA polymerase II transcription subunit 5 n=1 Tax=Candida maltosa (strain Xu316) TaxID=1245528 RepID=M3J8T6_CANMX|nr:hypothetical protein G210_0909 [Candida maltosa Xu316]
MSQNELSLSKLIKKSVNNKLSPKVFISLFNQFAKKSPIQNNEYVSSVLEIDSDHNSLRQRKWNEYKLNLIVELSFSSTDNSHLFWSNLSSASVTSQGFYLSKIKKNLSGICHYQKDVLRNLITNEFIAYVLSQKKFDNSSIHILNYIVDLLVVMIEKYNKFIKEDKSHAFQDLIIKLIPVLRSLIDGDHLALYLLKKSKDILTKIEFSQLENTKSSRMECHSSIVALTPAMQSNVSSLTMINKLDEYYSKMRYIWIHKLFSNFEYDSHVLDFFISNLVSIPNRKNSFFVAVEFLKCVFSGLDMNGYCLFNAKNFAITRVPMLLNRLRFGEDNLEKAVNDVLETLNFDDGFKKQILKSFEGGDATPLHVRENFNEKLLNINSEFTSLEESGLIEFVKKLSSVHQSEQIQKEITKTILDIVDELSYARDFEKLNRLLLAVMGNIELVNIVLFNSNYSLLYKLIDLVDSLDFKTDDDDENFQEYYSYCGIIILSILNIVETFNIDFSKIALRNSFIIEYLNKFYYRLCDNLTSDVPLNNEEEDNIIIANYQNLENEWINALFDDKNEGLSDDLIKSLNIKQIYKLVPLIYKQAIMATNQGRISWEILNNGLEYLSQPFLTVISPIIIKYLVRDAAIDNELKQKIIKELISDTTNLSVKMVINICGNDLVKLNFPEDITEIIKTNTHYLNNAPSIATDDNVKESFKDQLLGEVKMQDTFLKNYILSNKSELVLSLLQEIYNFQKSNHEDSKMYINLMVFLVLLDSVGTSSAKDYWKREFREKCTQKLQQTQTSQFESSLDFHYSSIFNDNSQTDVRDEMDDFLTNQDGDDDMMQQDDLFNEKPKTSEQLKAVLRKVHNHTCLVNKFRCLREKIGEDTLFSKAVRLLNDKLAEELNNWHI